MVEEKINFFKKVWYSIVKIERYPEMAAQGFGKAISYLAKIVAILAAIICIGTIYQFSNRVVDDSGKVTDEYKAELQEIKIEGFNIQEVVDFIESTRGISLYFSLFFVAFIYTFATLLILIAINAIYISVVGYLSSLVVRVKMRYIAIYNMSIYSLTLSIILCMIYVGINIFVPFNIKYFEVMYIAVAAIYIVAAILLLRENVIKNQMELTKIMQAEELVRKQMEEEEKEKQDNQEKEERKQKDKEEEQEDDTSGGEPCTFSNKK